MAVRNLSTQFLDIWAKLTTLQKVAIGAASVAVVAAVTVLLIWAYKPLYTDMTKDVVQAVSNQLRQQAGPV